jgi:hypothetical protein
MIERYEGLFNIGRLIFTGALCGTMVGILTNTPLITSVLVGVVIYPLVLVVILLVLIWLHAL